MTKLNQIIAVEKVLVVVEPVNDEEAQLPDLDGKWGQLEAVPDEGPPTVAAPE